MSCIQIFRAVVVVIAFAVAAPVAAQPLPSSDAHLQGWVVRVSDDSLTLRLRDGKEQKVDISIARAQHHTGVLPAGKAVIVYGTRDASGVFHAVSVGHSSPDPKQWAPDD